MSPTKSILYAAIAGVACSSSSGDSGPTLDSGGGGDGKDAHTVITTSHDARADVSSTKPIKDSGSSTGDAHHAPPAGDAGMHGPPPHVDSGSDDLDGGLVDAPFDASGVSDAEYPAFGFDVPQVNDYGAQVIASPVFVPIVFPDDAYASQIAAFISAIGPSDYWATIGTEYGVGPGSSTGLVTESAAPAGNIDDPEIQQFLAQAIATDPRFLALGSNLDAGMMTANPNAVPPSNALYVLYYPASTKISVTSLGESCTAFGGYHSAFNLSNGAVVSYAVIPRCATFDGLTGFDAVTSATSHELIEASTDPDPNVPSFLGTDTDHLIWDLTLGGEVADMCLFLTDANIHPTEASLSAYTVQRIWSNQQALKGEDPCVPSNGNAYFNTIPAVTDAPFVDQGSTYQTLATQIPVGQTATVTLDLVSSGATSGPWSVQVLDYGVAYGNPAILDLTLLGATRGENGQTLSLQIKAVQAGPASLHGISPYFIYSTIGSTSTFWVGAVVN